MDKEKELEKRVKMELVAVDVEQLLRELLDEDGPVEVMGLSFERSRIVEELDPVAFRCAVNDYYDTLSRSRDYEEIDEELYRADEVEALRVIIEAETEVGL